MKTYHEQLEQLKQQKLEYLDKLAKEQKMLLWEFDNDNGRFKDRLHDEYDELEARIGEQVAILRKFELLQAEITRTNRTEEQLAEQEKESQPQESNENEPKGFDGLKVKKLDLSGYYTNLLTPRQRDCYSLKNEYGLSVAEIARRLGITRPTVDEHLDAAEKRLKEALASAKEQKRIRTMHN